MESFAIQCRALECCFWCSLIKVIIYMALTTVAFLLLHHFEAQNVLLISPHLPFAIVTLAPFWYCASFYCRKWHSCQSERLCPVVDWNLPPLSPPDSSSRPWKAQAQIYKPHTHIAHSAGLTCLMKTCILFWEGLFKRMMGDHAASMICFGSNALCFLKKKDVLLACRSPLFIT